MQSETMKRITSKLRQVDIASKTFTSDPDELTFIQFDLYPTEVVRAAQTALGLKSMSEHFVEIYEFAQTAMTHNTKIKKSQLNGVVLTHNKITKWLVAQNIDDLFALHDPAVLRIYLRYHIARMQGSVDMFQKICDAIS